MWFESSILNYGVVLGLIGVLIYIYIQIAFAYWQKRGVPCIKTKTPLEIIMNIISGKKSISEIYQEVYNDLGSLKFGGVYQMFTPILVLKDPEVIKCVLLKDFDHFHERVLYFKEHKDPLAANLFTVSGQRWKNMRTKMTPGFTPTKMRLMFNTILETTHELKSHLEDLGEIVEIKEVFARFTMDVIASIAFGIKTNCLKEPDNEFRKWGKKVFASTPLTGIRNLINFTVPKLASIIYIPFFSKEITDHFYNLVVDTLNYRVKNNFKRDDFMQLLLQLRNKGFIEDEDTPTKEKDNCTENMSYSEIASLAVIFFTAGYETTATSIGFCIHELAVNPDVQSRLFDEVCTVLNKYNGQVTYDAIQEMEYMDMVIAESLRKYPPGPIVTRKCSEDFVLPETNIILEKGTPVVVPILGLHLDPQYFPDPEKFDPERFSVDGKSRFPKYVYMPFGEGPRNCIGSRFAIMEMKVAISVLLKKYEFQGCPQTKHPLTFDPRAFVLSSSGGMWLRVIKRTGESVQ